MSLKRMLALTGPVLLAFPASAYAATDLDVAATVSAITGAGSLVLCAMLLLIVVQLRRVAEGSAITENISYVVGASLALVAAVLVSWVDRYVNGFSGGFVRAGGDVLVMVCVLLLAVYFSRVKRSLSSFLVHIHSHDALAAANGAEDTEEETVA